MSGTNGTVVFAKTTHVSGVWVDYRRSGKAIALACNTHSSNSESSTVPFVSGTFVVSTLGSFWLRPRRAANDPSWQYPSADRKQFDSKASKFRCGMLDLWCR